MLACIWLHPLAGWLARGGREKGFPTPNSCVKYLRDRALLLITSFGGKINSFLCLLLSFVYRAPSCTMFCWRNIFIKNENTRRKKCIDSFIALLRSGLKILDFVPASGKTLSGVPSVLLAAQRVVKVHRHHAQHVELYPFSLLGPLPTGIYMKQS